ncbi:hypothetical protein ACFE04_022995 [Oxalis oulophora]
MPIGKPRPSKRASSSSSYTSTITTLIFIGLCVFGVWMLTSTSITPPQATTTTRTASDGAARMVVSSNNAEEQSNINVNTIMNTRSNKKDPPVFEDNPGDLPDDAIKSDDPKQKMKDAVATVAAMVEDNPQGKENEISQGKENENQISEESQSALTQNLQAEQQSSRNQNRKEETMEQNSNDDQQQQQQQEEQQPEQQQKQESEAENAIAQDDSSRINNVDVKESEVSTTSTQQQETEQMQEQQSTQQQEQQSETEQMLEQQQAQPQQEQQVEQQKQQQLQEDLGTTSNDEQQQQQKKQKKKKQKEQQKEELVQQTEVTEQQQETNSSESNSAAMMTSGGNSGIPKESSESKKAWKTQASQSATEKERRIDESNGKDNVVGLTWQLCNETAGADYIPCLDNVKAVKKLTSTKHYEHRERHCPEDAPTCLVQLPEGYKRPIKWPGSRDKIWYRNVPHTLLAQVKGHQNWVKVTGEFLTFPGGGTQFIHGALHYIDFIQGMVPDVKWGKHTRVVLDVGCGVASFGGFLFDKDVLAMSFAPKDEHEAQVQFALERGIPAISAVMGSQRLPFPSMVFDIIHCARCRVPWHADGGLLLLELNRLLRPGGYFVWSATPVYQKLAEDVGIWKAMTNLTKSMCWDLVNIEKDAINSIGAAIFRKPSTNECYDNRKRKNPPMCKDNDDPNAAWYVPLQACMHRVPVDPEVRGSQWPEEWPLRLQKPPYWMNSSQMGIYGKPSPQDFEADLEHWKKVVKNVYMTELGINWSNVRNVMEMRAVYGGFAAALKDFPIWVVNVVNVNAPDTLPIIYERGLFGIYHDWCESFSTYPRTYDLLHADHLFSSIKNRCKLVPVMAEIDRVVRPGGKLIVRDESGIIGEVESLLKSMHWEVHLTYSRNQEGILSAEKGDWRPEASAIL